MLSVLSSMHTPEEFQCLCQIFKTHFTFISFPAISTSFFSVMTLFLFCRSKQQIMAVLRNHPPLGSTLSGSVVLHLLLCRCSSTSPSTTSLSWRMTRWLRLWVWSLCGSTLLPCGLTLQVKPPLDEDELVVCVVWGRMIQALCLLCIVYVKRPSDPWFVMLSPSQAQWLRLVLVIKSICLIDFFIYE